MEGNEHCSLLVLSYIKPTKDHRPKTVVVDIAKRAVANRKSTTMEAVTKLNPWDYSLRTFIEKLLSWSFDAYKELTSSWAEKPIEVKAAPVDSSTVCYPNCDLAIWLRTCDVEIETPLEGITTGNIPLWINGSLYRNGPGKQRYEHQTVNHLFDASGLLHCFKITNGRATYQCRYVRSKAYNRNVEAQRIVVSEFTTPAIPDPCKTIFHKVSSLFIWNWNGNIDLDKMISDNAMISIYPLCDNQLYAFAETPFIHRIDPVTLETTGREELRNTLGIIHQSSHPHVSPTEGAYNMGEVLGATGPNYAVVHFPNEPGTPGQVGRIVCRIPCRWPSEPSYMHSFSITENHFVLIEQPLTVRMGKVIANVLWRKPLISALKWRDVETRIRVVSRQTGKETVYEYLTEPIFFLHTINAYEDQNHLVLDICCYRDPKMLDCMYVEALKNAQSQPDYAKLFRGRPKRFVLPLEPQKGVEGNLNSLSYSASKAFWHKEGTIYVQPDELCSLGCETPRINYDVHNARMYRYFYAISSDVDADNPGTLIKVDAVDKKHWTWAEPNVYASEPVFIPRPDPKSEDDGVVLSSLIWGGGENECRSGILVLDARTWTELGRTEFRTPSPVPKCLHGWFLDNQDINKSNQ